MSDISQTQTNTVTAVQRNLQKMRALPEHKRKFFAMLTMLGAMLMISAISWMLFSPLQGIGTPISEHEPASAMNGASVMIQGNTEVKQKIDADIPHVGPINSFLGSLDAIKGLFVPNTIPDTMQANISDISWRDVPRIIVTKLQNFFLFAVHIIKPYIDSFITFVRGYTPHLIDTIIAFLNKMFAFILYIWELFRYFFLAIVNQIADVINHIMDRFISRLGISI